MKYDVPLKTILKSSRSNLRAALGIHGECRDLPINFPVREHDGDFLALVKDGRRRPYLAHFELQTDRHPDMLSRMLGYRADIRSWQRTSGDAECRDLHIFQTVVYVGAGSRKPKMLLEEPQIRFDVAYQDVKSLDSELLFASNNADDAALAVLFRDGDKRYMIEKIVRRIAEVSKSDSEAIDAGALLNLFAQLRKSGKIAAEEWRKMNFSVDLNDSPLLKEGLDRARAETAIRLIEQALQEKFAGTVPSDIQQRLAGRDIGELEAINRRIIKADTVEEALTGPAPSTAP